MLFWTHFIVGVFVALVYSFFDSSVLSFFVIVFSSLVPDIDSPTSKLGRKGISKVMMAFFKHRGIVHSFFFMFVIYFILLTFWQKVSFPFLLGYSIHLVLDCFTRRGVRLFWPFKLKCIGFVRSGGLFEVFLLIVFFVLDVFLIASKII